MLDKIKNLFGLGVKTKEPRPKPPSEASPKSKRQSKKEPSPKELANKNGEPYIAITKVHIDPNDINNGAFELDWNDKFLANLVRAGYQGKTDADIVDNWFKAVCRNVVLEAWEQEQADPEKRSSNRTDLGNGRTEVR